MEEETPGEMCARHSAMPRQRERERYSGTGSCLSKAWPQALVSLIPHVSAPPQGLCKLGSAGGTDYGLRQFAEGSTEKLAKQCRK